MKPTRTIRPGAFSHGPWPGPGPRRTPGRRRPRKTAPSISVRARRPRERPRRGTSRCGGRRASAPGAAQRGPALDDEAVGPLLGPGAERGEALGQGRDAVALLDAQLARAGDREGPSRAGGGHGEGRHLVDQGGHELGVDRRPAKLRRARHDRADRLGVARLERASRPGRPWPAARRRRRCARGRAGRRRSGPRSRAGRGPPPPGRRRSRRRPARPPSVPRRRAPPRTVAARPSRSTATPKAGSRRSVWSRLGLGSRTVVTPSACRPASRTAVFTWALATGSS